MLAAIGVGSLQEIFDRQIPAAVRLGRELQLPDGLGEQDVYEHLRALAARNTSVEDELSFLGAGMYDHYVPALIDMLTERSEFLTPYTPYQPEISQGTLQVMFEYQTAISELTGLPVSNASMYEGPSAKAATGGRASSPPVVVAHVDPITLGIRRPPGECGVDVAVGEGQPLGNRLDYGGPSFGLFAAREEYLRRMPGRIAGETVDVDGRRGFVLTLQTREQHIRREKATSNICTAQALNALGGVVYLSWLGRRGMVELGELLLARTHYARETLCALDGVQALHSQPVIREFAVRLDVDVAAVKRRCAGEGVNPGVDIQALSGREVDRGGLLVALTERRTRADIDRLAEVLGATVAAVGRQGPTTRRAESAGEAVPA